MSDPREGMEPAPILNTDEKIESRTVKRQPLTIELSSDSFTKFKNLDINNRAIREALAAKGIKVNSGTLLIRIRETEKTVEVDLSEDNFGNPLKNKKL